MCKFGILSLTLSAALLLPDGRYLMIFHIGNRRHDGVREYDLGLAIADFRKQATVVKRIDPWIRPQTPAETRGDATLGVNDVLFICGAYLYEGDLYFPYAGADSVVLGGMVKGKDLQEFVGTHVGPTHRPTTFER